MPYMSVCPIWPYMEGGVCADMKTAVMKVAVVGSGAGALAVAADMSRHGRRTVLAGIDGSRAGLDLVAERGGILVSDGGQGVNHPVSVAGSIGDALDGAELVVVAVPCSAHEHGVQAIAPHTTPDQTVLFVGDGSGAIVARRAIEPPTVVAETNTLPCLARSTGPGAVSIAAKRGGVLIAALPPTPPDKARAMELIGDVWPCAAATDTVWTTVLASYDAINRATTAESVIEAVDAELLAVRRALNSTETRGYHDFLVAQSPDADPAPDLGDLTAGMGPAPSNLTAGADPGPDLGDLTAGMGPDPSNLTAGLDRGPDLGDLTAGMGLDPSNLTAGLDRGPDLGDLTAGAGLDPSNLTAGADPDACDLTAGVGPHLGPGRSDLTAGVPCALVLASSLGQAAGVPTPQIDGLVAAAAASQGQAPRTGGRTLAALGLDGLDVTGLVGFARTGLFP